MVVKIYEDPERYTSVRSSKLREALERSQASRSKEALHISVKGSSKQDPEPRVAYLRDQTPEEHKAASLNDACGEEEKDFSYAERLLRAQTGRKRVGFVAQEHAIRSNWEHDDEDREEADSILRSIVEESDILSVLDELTSPRVRFVLPEPPLSSNDETLSTIGTPSITDEDMHTEEEEENLTESQTSASERAFGSRRTRKRGPRMDSMETLGFGPSR